MYDKDLKIGRIRDFYSCGFRLNKLHSNWTVKTSDAFIIFSSLEVYRSLVTHRSTEAADKFPTWAEHLTRSKTVS